MFSPPVEQVSDWKYLNKDKKTKPDYCCSVEQIPIDSKSIDSIIMTEVLEYIEDTDAAFKEIYRILTRNGKLLISVPFLHPIHGDYQEDRGRYTPTMISEMLERNGFSIEMIKPMGSVGAVIYDIFRVSIGYSCAHFFCRLLGRVLPVFFPVFYLIDKMTINQSKFINTGYFVIAVKCKK